MSRKFRELKKPSLSSYGRTDEQEEDEHGKLSHRKTGRRCIYIDAPSQPLPKTLKMGLFAATLFHEEQKAAPLCGHCLNSQCYRRPGQMPTVREKRSLLFRTGKSQFFKQHNHDNQNRRRHTTFTNQADVLAEQVKLYIHSSTKRTRHLTTLTPHKNSSPNSTNG